MAIITIGIDLAKNVFAVHGVGESGKPELVRLEVTRAKLLELVANLSPMPDRHGSLLRRPPLGTRVCQVRTHRAPNGAQVRHTLPHGWQARQERRGRCGGRHGQPAGRTAGLIRYISNSRTCNICAR